MRDTLGILDVAAPAPLPALVIFVLDARPARTRSRYSFRRRLLTFSSRAQTVQDHATAAIELVVDDAYDIFSDLADATIDDSPAENEYDDMVIVETASHHPLRPRYGGGGDSDSDHDGGDGGDDGNGPNDQEDDDLDGYVDWSLLDNAAGGDRVAGGTLAIPARAETFRPHETATRVAHTDPAVNDATWSWMRPETNAAPDERDPSTRDAGSPPRDMDADPPSADGEDVGPAGAARRRRRLSGASRRLDFDGAGTRGGDGSPEVDGMP